MKERSIVMQDWEVQAILAGRKTQFRRVVQVQPPEGRVMVFHDNGMFSVCLDDQREKFPGPYEWKQWRSPYKPGDRLWVKETWSCVTGDTDSSAASPCDAVAYRAANDQVSEVVTRAKARRSATHMPRAYSRLTLEVVGVRVERLQAITEADAIAEGIELVSGSYNRDDFSGCWKDYSGEQYYWNSPIDSFHSIWASIHGKEYPWASNPWVRAVTFKPVEASQ